MRGKKAESPIKEEKPIDESKIQRNRKGEIVRSPRNGQIVPKGRTFTSETAREAQRKSVKVKEERKSIAQAFRKSMLEVHEMRDKKGNIVEKTGAEIIAESIMVACNKGNANAMNIALGLMGEKPAEKIAISAPNTDVIKNVESVLFGTDGK